MKKWVKVPIIVSVLVVIADSILINFNYFGHLKDENNIKYLDVFHCFTFILFLWSCISVFTQDVFLAATLATLVLFDKRILHLVTDRTQLSDEDIPPWTQQFFFISLLITPVLSRHIMLNNFSAMEFILYTLLMLIVSLLPIFSLYTTFIPLVISICTIVNKFVHVDTSKSYRPLKNHLLVTFQIFLFLTLSELFHSKYVKDIINKLQSCELCDKPIEYLVGQKYSLFQSKALCSSDQLKYFSRLGDFFANDNEFQIVIIGYFLATAFYKKVKQYYENCFIFIACLSLMISSFEDPNGSEIEIHFFVFKIYLLIAFSIQISKFKLLQSAISILLVEIFLIWHNDNVLRSYLNDFLAKSLT